MGTNEELIELMQQKGLTIPDVAALLESSENTVKGWRANPESTRFRKMSAGTLRHLKLELGQLNQPTK